MLKDQIGRQIDRERVLSLPSLKFLAVTLLALGIFFRFVNLDQKAYWFDETSTSLQISGYTDSEVTQQVLDGRVIGIKDLQKYQYPNPEKGAIDTIKGLAEKEPQLTPLYFVMARFWVQWFGNSVAVTRSLSALISLLAFPGVYWLCMELFGSPLTGWIAIALICVSPFHVLYAQEARPYALWTVAILLSDASLLQAIRLQTKRSWGIYAATVILGLYSYLFSALVFIGHGIYVVVIERKRSSKTLIAYVIASLIGTITFVPWIFFALTNFQRTNKNSWQATATPFLNLAKGWVRSLSLFFVDFNLNESSKLIYLVAFSIILLILLILVGYSIYFFFNTPKQVWLFILISIAVPALLLLLPDLLLGGLRSTTTRYLIPCYLCIQLTVAYLFATQIAGFSIQFRQHKLWKNIMLALILIGIFSCVEISQSKVWWTKAENNVDHHLAQIINQANQPLLISDTYFVEVLSISHLLAQKVRFQLVVEPNLPSIPDGFSNVFLFKASQTLQDKLEKKYSIKPIYSPFLWRLEKQ